MFKVGDKVRIVKDDHCWSDFYKKFKDRKSVGVIRSFSAADEDIVYIDFPEHKNVGTLVWRLELVTEDSLDTFFD